jgi:hypothetical protein
MCSTTGDPSLDVLGLTHIAPDGDRCATAHFDFAGGLLAVLHRSPEHGDGRSPFGERQAGSPADSAATACDLGRAAFQRCFHPVCPVYSHR